MTAPTTEGRRFVDYIDIHYSDDHLERIAPPTGYALEFEARFVLPPRAEGGSQ